MNVPVAAVASEGLLDRLFALREAGAELLTAFWDTDDAGHPVVRYAFAVPDPDRPGRQLEEPAILAARPEGGRLPSGAPAYPTLAWYERRIRDAVGIAFEGHPDPRAILVHDHEMPLLVRHKGLHRIPLGPKREAVVESSQFLFETVGEEIVRVAVRLHFKHRGIEALAAGRPLWQAIPLAERIAGLSSVAHAVAAASAIEAALGLEVPERALVIRLVLQEGERIYNHVGDTAWLCRAAGLSVGEAELAGLKESLLRENARLTGHRYLRGVVAVGGLACDLPDDSLLAWAVALGETVRRFLSAVAALDATPTFLDRIETTGKLSAAIARDFQAVGPVARASGLPWDARATSPYGAYRTIPVEVATEAGCDALARYRVRVREVAASLDLIQRSLGRLPAGPCRDPRSERALAEGKGAALAWAETPRGRAVVWLRAEGGRIVRFAPRAASFHNWRAFPHAVPGNILTDFPLIEASFALSPAENDL